ncbi:hypothetical protein Lal_00048550 [Lupinus albus]|nr:hypothetical protein Lal_00048550 [Lupinus albus]
MALVQVQSWPLFQLALGKCVTASISPSTRTHVSCPQCHRARVMSSLPPSTFVIPALSPSTRDHARGTTPHAQSTQPPHSMTHTQGTMLARHGAWPEAMPHTTLAESQWIVAARPLCHLQYPVAYLSRLQRILPAAQWGIALQGVPRGSSTPRGSPTARASGGRGPLLLVGKRATGTRIASSPDSDLEAFSHNPTHGSFAPLAFQPSAMTNCANQRLNYYCDTGKTNLSHDGLNPAHVPYWWVNNPTLGEFCFTMIGRADIEGSKSNVAMNAWLPQASYPCGNFSDTSSFKFRRTKGSIGHAFTVRIRTGNQNQTSFYPFVPHEISVLVELILGHLRYLLTDVPPQPNSPPDNVFRPDRPTEAGLGSKNRGCAPPPIHGIIGFPLSVPVLSRLFDARGRGPEGPVPNPSPDRHAATRSRRESSSSSPPTADGFGTGTPVPSPQSQSFSRGYGSILPTSLAYIVPSTRGCSPWRPDAVMSTTGRGRHSVLRIFKGRRGRTGHHATCGALPAAGPYLRLSRFQGGQAICTDDRSARAHAPGFAATAAPSYSSGPGPCPDGRVSAQLGTVTQLPVHPASPVLLTKNGPLGALDSVAWLNEAATPSYLFKSDERFARQYRCGPPPEFPLASPRSGIVHHLSGPDRYALTRTLHRRSGSVGGATHKGSHQSASLRLTGLLAR